MYCPDIHHNVSVHYNNQTVKVGPCCQAEHNILEKRQEIIQHPRLLELRRINQDQGSLTDDCRACTRIESMGGQSRRQSQIKFYKDYKKTSIRGVDIHLGNLCNLSCVICGPDNSTSWIADAKKIGTSIKKEWLYDKRNQFDLTWIKQLNDLEMVHFWGGEPLIDDRHLTVISNLNDINVLKSCRITYNTNATQIPSQAAIELWRKAHLVELYFSIDDISNRFEYQRTGAKWESVCNNFKWYTQMPTTNHLFYFTVTWSMLNLFYLPELIDWKKSNFNSNRFGDYSKLLFNQATGFCEVHALPSKIFAALEKKFAGYDQLDFILNGIRIDDRYVPTKFMHYIKSLDQIRGMDYAKIHPEWWNLIRT